MFHTETITPITHNPFVHPGQQDPGHEEASTLPQSYIPGPAHQWSKYIAAILIKK